MKKIILLISLFISVFVNAQSVSEQKNNHLRYQGEVQVGYSIGVGNYKADRANLHMINGVRLSQYASVGLGLGLDYYCSNGASQLMMPIFVNVKGYLPIGENVNAFASLDGGYSVGLTKGLKGLGGFLVTPAVGV